MVLMDIYKLFEQRKQSIRKLLNNGSAISPEQKHKLQGAMAEIDIFLKTLEHYNKQPEKTISPNLATPEKSKGLLSKFSKSLKKSK